MKSANDDLVEHESRKTLASEMREADTLFVAIGLLAVCGALVMLGIAGLMGAL